MFKWFYRWRLKRFVKQYFSQGELPYRQAEVILRLMQLSEPFLSNASYYYHGHTQHIVTYYATVTKWLDETGRVLVNIARDTLRPRASLKSMEITLEQFLLTEEEYTVEYGSAIKAVSDQLDLLYSAVLSPHYPAEKQDYYFRQLEEEFLTGLRFYLTFINQVIHH